MFDVIVAGPPLCHSLGLLFLFLFVCVCVSILFPFHREKFLILSTLVLLCRCFVCVTFCVQIANVVVFFLFFSLKFNLSTLSRAFIFSLLKKQLFECCGVLCECECDYEVSKCRELFV